MIERILPEETEHQEIRPKTWTVSLKVRVML